MMLLLNHSRMFVGFAWHRRRKLQPEVDFQHQFRVCFSTLHRFWASHGLWDRVLAILLIVAIAGTIGVLAYVIVAPNTGERFTEFYVLGRSGQADDYPTRFVIEDNEVITVTYSVNDTSQTVSETFGTITLGVVNREYAEATYQIRIRIDGEQVDFHLSGNMVDDIGPITLAHQEKWENEIGFAPEHVGASQKVEFVLYKGGEAYLDEPIHLWIDVVN